MRCSGVFLLVNYLLAVASSFSAMSGPVSDPAGLLSRQAIAEVTKAVSVFKQATGHWMVVVTLPSLDGQETSELAQTQYALWDKAVPQTPIGIIYVMSPKAKSGTLLIVDTVWQKALPAQWRFLFPQRLAENYGDEVFERRVVLSAQYLATVFADKLAFVLKPRGGELSPGSVRFARGSYIGLALLGYFIILFTVFRTFWPARLRDEDQDEFSNELRRLKKERQIW